MIPESTLQIIFASIFVSVFSVGFYFRLKAHRQKDHFERMKNEGKATFFILRLCGGVLWFTAFLFPFVPEWFDVVRYEGTPLLQLIGILFALTAVPMGISVFTNIGKNITDTVETRKNHELITTGIYRHIRHPLYTTGFCFFVGLGLLSSNWLILLFSFVVLITLYVRTFTEEKKLIEEFGNRYVDYMTATGKFLPKIF